MSNFKSNWFESGGKTGGFSFEKTENYIFAKGTPQEKRVGDMNRDELIRMIAVGYHEREEMATALNMYAAFRDPFESMDFSSAIDLAQLIVSKRQMSTRGTDE